MNRFPDTDVMFFNICYKPKLVSVFKKRVSLNYAILGSFNLRYQEKYILH